MGWKDKLKKMPVIGKTGRRMRRIGFDLKNGINFRKTILLNFKFLPFRTAVRFPVIVYGRLQTTGLSGTLKIQAPVTHRMIKWGLNVDKFAASKGAALLDLQGTLVFNGPALLSADCTVNVGKNATLVMGKYTYCGNGVRIRCWKKIEIGDYTDISLESQIYDTDFHYTRDLKTGDIAPSALPVKIGRFCWTGSRVTLLKGTVVPDYTIIASMSLLTKDYRPSVVPGSLIGGVPARLLKSGTVRVHDPATIEKAEVYYGWEEIPEIKLAGTPGWRDDREEIEKFYQDI